MKAPWIFASLAAVLLCMGGNVHAQQWVAGGQVGFTETKNSLRFTDTDASVLGLSVDCSGKEFGGFVQYRGEVFGLHAGIASNSTRGLGMTIDLLGMFVYEGEHINGIGMFGFSSLEWNESSATSSVDDTASGWKVAAGIEIPLPSRWNLQFTYERVDLDGADVDNQFPAFPLKVDLTHSGFFLRMGYRF